MTDNFRDFSNNQQMIAHMVSVNIFAVGCEPLV